MQEILIKIGAIGKKCNVKVYLVGGAVRDMLLGKKEFGIDIAVEGNGIEFAKILQREFGGELRTHEKFETASLIIRRGINNPNFVAFGDKVGTCLIDIASCREEEYPESAKLPKIKLGTTLYEDLKRRDFTINAMAINLETNDLIDPFGGKQDLQAGLIRVLHPNSFIDDPTRIFRAIRFAGRLGFRLESKTALMAKKAIRAGLIKKLTPKRIRNEIILIFKEPNRTKILELMDELGIAKQLGFKLPPPNLFRNIDNNLMSHLIIQYPVSSIQYPEWLVYLFGIIDLKKPPTLLGLTRKELQKINHTYTIISNIRMLEVANKPSKIYELLKNAGNEELLFIASRYPKLKPKILTFVQIYKKIKLRITGKDLLKLGIKPGPLYKELLTATLHNKLDGNLHTKKEELECIKNLLKDYEKSLKVSCL